MKTVIKIEVEHPNRINRKTVVERITNLIDIGLADAQATLEDDPTNTRAKQVMALEISQPTVL